MIIKNMRKYKIGPFAIFDFAASYIVVFFIWYLFTQRKQEILRKMMIGVIPLAILTHLIFRIDTPLTEMFTSTKIDTSSIITKIITVVSVYVSLK